MPQNPRYCPLPDFRTLVISGADRFEFLQGQLTQDTARLQADGSIRAGWTSPKGRLLACGQLINAEERVLWPLPADIAESVMRRLGMFVLRADVQISISEIAVGGLLDIEAAQPCEPGDGCTIAPVIGDHSRAWALGPVAATTQRESATQWQLADIQKGLPLIVAATQETFVPQMVNLDLIDGISFEKGCYVGQEIVARTQNLGRIKRRMYRFSFSGDTLPEGEVIYGPDNVTGKIVSAIGGESLAVIPIEQADSDWHLDADRTQELTLETLPYSIHD